MKRKALEAVPKNLGLKKAKKGKLSAVSAEKIRAKANRRLGGE